MSTTQDKAKAAVAGLTDNANDYHFGRIDFDAFYYRNTQVWIAVEEEPAVHEIVLESLRKINWTTMACETLAPCTKAVAR